MANEFTPENYRDYLRGEALKLATGEAAEVEINTQVIKDLADEDFQRTCTTSYICMVMNRVPEVREIGRVSARAGRKEDLGGATYLHVSLVAGKTEGIKRTQLSKRMCDVIVNVVTETAPDVLDLNGDMLEGSVIGARRYREKLIAAINQLCATKQESESDAQHE